MSYWTITRCGSCGVHFPNPFPSSDEVRDYYGNQLVHNEWEEVHYVEESEERAAGWSKVASRLTRLNGGPGELLEVGPAAGHLMEAARGQGWSVMGVEASPKFTRLLQERGLPYHEGTLETFETDRRFDVIVMLDVLEHLHDPVADLARCAELLDADGSVVVATCDIGSSRCSLLRPSLEADRDQSYVLLDQGVAGDRASSRRDSSLDIFRASAGGIPTRLARGSSGSGSSRSSSSAKAYS